MRRILPWMIALCAAAVGCDLIAGADRSLIPRGTGGGSGGSGGSGGTGGAPCLHAFDCPGTDTPCLTRDCVHERCVPVLAAEGTPTDHQIPGDCHKEICDGKGNVEVVEDDTNTLDDGNPCTADTCYEGTPGNAPGKPGAACSAGGGAVCDPVGRCVGCLAGAQCGEMICFNTRCEPQSCMDGVRDGSETDVDCGGPACVPCATGGACNTAGDCASGVCSGSICQAPSCTDGVENGTETGVDCGGGCPEGCPAGEGCAGSDDCAGGLCSGTVCLPTCMDGEKDGAETGLDCGGYACSPCADGGGCLYDSDCEHRVCRSGICLPPRCVDGERDGTETGVDCGGDCPPCGPGQGCAVAGDCTSHLCAGTLCSTPSCSDGVRNGDETGVDCGGPACASCPVGQGCDVANDCASGLCEGGLCAQPSCTDGIQDGTETGVDCGGGCPGCPGGQPCLVSTDCGSLVCAMGACTDSTCSDGIENEGESDVDCGGPCAPCGEGKTCAASADCVTHSCVGGTCAGPSCTDGIQDGVETDTDCGGGTCPACALGKHCKANADCASAGCSGGACVEVLLIGEVKTHGAGGLSDEFVELYNPGTAAVTVDATWTVNHRNAITPCATEISQVKFAGGGQTVPPHGHLLIVGTAYAGAVTADAPLVNGALNDAANIVVMHGTAVVDAIRYYFDAASQANLMTCSTPYTCPGTPVSNLPHDDTTSAAANVDASLQRKPGGAAGNGQSTGSSAADFMTVMPSDPEDLASPPTP